MIGLENQYLVFVLICRALDRFDCIQDCSLECSLEVHVSTEMLLGQAKHDK